MLTNTINTSSKTLIITSTGGMNVLEILIDGLNRIDVFIILLMSQAREKQIKAIRSSVLAKYSQLVSPLALSTDRIRKMEEQVGIRHKELLGLFAIEHKHIANFFGRYTPLDFVGIDMKDVGKYGGAKVVVAPHKIYIGSLLEGKRHGKGIIVSKTGKIYEGQMVKGEREGTGLEIHQDGNFYYGQFRANKRHGEGRIIWINSDRKAKTTSYSYYSGLWKDGEPQGQGYHVMQNYGFYGEFKGGVRNGHGIEVIDKHNIYEGQFKRGKYEGRGRLWKKGEYYEGQFRAGQKHGYGEWLDWHHHQTYEGFFQHDSREGIGEFKAKIGIVYRGMFTENCPNGVGQYRMNGRKHTQRGEEKAEGEWVITKKANDSQTRLKKIGSKEEKRGGVSRKMTQSTINLRNNSAKVAPKMIKSEFQTRSRANTGGSRAPKNGLDSLIKDMTSSVNPEFTMRQRTDKSKEEHTSLNSPSKQFRIFSSRKKLLHKAYQYL